MHPVDREPIDIYLPPGDFRFGSSGVRIRAILAACVSVVAWHRQRRIGGMCHYLPPAAGGGEKSGRDALPLFLAEVRRTGAPPREYEIRLVGGGRPFSRGIDNGRRNLDLARRQLRHHGLAVQGEHLAGVAYRHVIFDVDSGTVWLKHLTDASLAWQRA